MQVAPSGSAIPWVRCASGNVFYLLFLEFSVWAVLFNSSNSSNPSNSPNSPNSCNQSNSFQSFNLSNLPNSYVKPFYSIWFTGISSILWSLFSSFSHCWNPFINAFRKRRFFIAKFHGWKQLNPYTLSIELVQFFQWNWPSNLILFSFSHCWNPSMHCNALGENKYLFLLLWLNIAKYY